MLQREPEDRPDSYEVLKRLCGLQSADFCSQCFCLASRGQTLTEACRNGDLNRVCQLLENEPLNDGFSFERNPGAIHQAAAHGHEQIVRTLITKSSDKRGLVMFRCHSGQTALHCAASCASELVSLVELLLRLGADPTSVDDEGRTALHYAAGQGHSNIIKLLLARNSTLAAEKDEGSEQTALHIAAKKGHARAVRVLLNQSIMPLDQKARYGITPLQFAAGCGSAEVVILLIGKGAMVQAEDDKGKTALHWAAQGTVRSEVDYANVFRILIKKNADCWKRDGIGAEGNTPMDYARRNSDKRWQSLMAAVRWGSAR
jgi:ankyrin repeat protein